MADAYHAAQRMKEHWKKHVVIVKNFVNRPDVHASLEQKESFTKTMEEIERALG